MGNRWDEIDERGQRVKKTKFEAKKKRAKTARISTEETNNPRSLLALRVHELVNLTPAVLYFCVMLHY
jgi:pimeloyl-CoA synthetase